MERIELESIFGRDYIGPAQVGAMLETMKLPPLRPEDIPPVPYPDDVLRACAGDFLLVLGYPGPDDNPLDILKFRDCFGVDPEKSEPCLYNQDWYLKEDFVRRRLSPRWYLLRKEVLDDTRSVAPDRIQSRDIVFPEAILCVYAFFAYYIATGKPLWVHDFVWCSDTDHNGDRIYVGKYHDIDGVNKNGFSIHRHLALRPCYASISVM